jgi:hypothetical protein
MPDPKPEPDASADTLRAIEELTGSEPVNGEDLIGDPETARKFREAKERAAARARSAQPA